MTDKENITAILECYFPGFKEEIIESACNRILEQEPCENFKQKAGVVIEQLRADRDRLATALEEIRVEINGLKYYWCEVHPRTVIDDVLEIIDKHRKGEE